VLLGNGDGSFQTTDFGYVGGGDRPDSVAVGDFNGDGSPDLAVANRVSNDVSIMLNDGAWTGPRPGGRPNAGSSLGRIAGVRNRPGLAHSAALANAQLADAALLGLRTTSLGPVAGDSQRVLPLPETVGRRDIAARSPNPLDTCPQPRAQTAVGTAGVSKTRPRPTLLDLFFADAARSSIDGTGST
jgi:hypothetical protein